MTYGELDLVDGTSRFDVPMVYGAPNKESARLVRMWARKAAKRLGIPGLVFVVRFSFTYDLPFEVVGRAQVRGLIRLNKSAWRTMNRRQKRRTVIHEFAHIAEIVQHASLSAHGRLFAHLMKKAGCPPNRIDLQQRGI